MCLAQGHTAVTPARLEPAAPLSRVKHSATEPLRSHCLSVHATLCMLGNFPLGFVVGLRFFFKTNLSRTISACQTALVQTLCKGCEWMTKVVASKEIFFNYFRICALE